MRLNLETIMGLSLRYQGKRGITKVSLQQPKEDQHKLEIRSPMIRETSTMSQEDDNKLLVERDEIQMRHLDKPLVCFMHKWALMMQIKGKLEPLIVVEALGSTHWRKATERENQSLVHIDT